MISYFFSRNAFKETLLCGKEQINSTYATRTEAINIQNTNGLNGQNRLNRNSLNGQNGQNGNSRNGQGFQADVDRISQASEVKISETVVLLNGTGTTRKLSQASSVNKGTILVENFEDCFKDTRYWSKYYYIVLSCSMHIQQVLA